ncbi:hypothetical protein GGR55DRAFT_703962 [Xylaria sp. FL0064]|nr:hypothetical protein GGR55DRAFT_703962 [Xylaria sp. FL0064]
MEQRPRAKSILEFLVAENPRIRPAPTLRTQSDLSRSNTRTGGQWAPLAFEDWAEFDPTVLKTIYGGELWKAVSKERGPNDAGPTYYPFMSQFDLQVGDEASTACVIQKWNQTISSELKFLERLLKDYKPALKWDSRVLRRGGEFINDEGEWAAPGKSKQNKVLPIRQIYTYCVEWGCRYGCIISTQEAFIFRIKPRSVSPGLVGDKQIKRCLEADGVMEYVSIPWDNYADSDVNKVPQKWTMNLALWFVHVLAGNYHKVAKEYPSLSSETLVMPLNLSKQKLHFSRKESVRIEQTGDCERPGMVRSSMKRAREEDFATNNDAETDADIEDRDTSQEVSQYMTNDSESRATGNKRRRG